MHIMKLQEKYFNYIKNGTKEYEIRLNDEKRKDIKIGDLIEFQKEPLKEEKIIYEVEDLLYFSNFNELINNIDIKYIADVNDTKEDLLLSLNKFYSEEDQNKYGVVAIKLKKNNGYTIEKGYVSNIGINDYIFDNIKNNYSNFNDWYLKLCNNNEECYFTKKDENITSLFILKINENDSQQIDIDNVLKIRTLNVLDNNKGIGKTYLNIASSIATSNDIKTIYVTCKNDNKEFTNFIENNNYTLYKTINDELIYIKRV